LGTTSLWICEKNVEKTRNTGILGKGHDYGDTGNLKSERRIRKDDNRCQPGSALAEKKKRVLLIDVDPQGSASSWLGFRNPSKGLFTLFTENGSITDIVSKTGIDGLDIIQSSPWLIGADRALAERLELRQY